MPLENAKEGTPGFGRNIAREEKAGKPAKQAEAIAYSKAKGDSFESRLDAACGTLKDSAVGGAGFSEKLDALHDALSWPSNKPKLDK